MWDYVAGLIKQGADVNTADTLGFTSLHHAKFLGSTETIALLEKHGAKVRESTALSVVGADNPLELELRSGPPLFPTVDYKQLAKELAPLLAGDLKGRL